ncbi:hypothetical protein QJQ45_010135 [Haematococcus lacustris]|nr:hypothetical protein QJQ45_010135 [Haematococcus lacustris]
MSLVAQCLRGSAVPRSKSRIRLKARENKVLAPLQANNARSKGLKGTDQLRGRVVLVDEQCTSRVSSAVNGQQPCERQLSTRRATRPADWKPPPGQVEYRLVRPAWSQQRDPIVPPPCSRAATQPAASEPGPSTPPPAQRSKRTKAEPAAEPTKGKDKAAKAKPAQAALYMQRVGESRWRPLELCWWPDQGALPAKGKEYPGLGYKRLRDKQPKTQPAVAQ